MKNIALAINARFFQRSTDRRCHCIGVFSDAVSSTRKLAIERH